MGRQGQTTIVPQTSAMNSRRFTWHLLVAESGRRQGYQFSSAARIMRRLTGVQSY